MQLDHHSAIWRSEDPPASITTCTGGCRVCILYSWWWARDARNMYRKSAVIKSAFVASSRCFIYMAEWWSTCIHNYLYRWLPCLYFILLMMGAWRPKHVQKICSNKICTCCINSVFNLNIVSSYTVLLWAVYSGTVQEVRWARDLLCVMEDGRCRYMGFLLLYVLSKLKYLGLWYHAREV